jgi:hypothetical protein
VDFLLFHFPAFFNRNHACAALRQLAISLVVAARCGFMRRAQIVKDIIPERRVAGNSISDLGIQISGSIDHQYSTILTGSRPSEPTSIHSFD